MTIVKNYKVGGMDCDACAKMIELDLEDLGIKSSCSYANKSLKVELGSDKESVMVVNSLKKSGYDITES